MIRAISFQTFQKRNTKIIYEEKGLITVTKRQMDYMILGYDHDGHILAMDFGNEKLLENKIEHMKKYINKERNPFF